MWSCGNVVIWQCTVVVNNKQIANGEVIHWIKIKYSAGYVQYVAMLSLAGPYRLPHAQEHQNRGYAWVTE